jgi:hypothetical protein
VREPVSRAGSIAKRTLVSFYDDQMTHHAAALTYRYRPRITERRCLAA